MSAPRRRRLPRVALPLTSTVLVVALTSAPSRAAQAAAERPWPAEPAGQPAAPGPGDPVGVTGVGPTGETWTAHGTRTDAGTTLVDTTTPTYDASSGGGSVATYDASQVQQDSDLPGRVVTVPGTTVDDPEAIAAQAFSRAVYDYYRVQGRDSWDGANAPVVSSVHYAAMGCNAAFIDALDPPQMVYGDGCNPPGVRPTNISLVDIDITGHEMTHGVTYSSSDLIPSGQSGALNEAFSDYFGNVIGDRLRGRDSAAFGEGNCVGIDYDTGSCHANPDGTRSLRYLLSGRTFDDYVRILNPGLRLARYLDVDQDLGGVHVNAGVWTNALWAIRSRLAQIDGQPAVSSPLAHGFDRAVYVALTTGLTPTSTFLDARTAVERAVVDLGLDAVVLRVAREEFDHDRICAGCESEGSPTGEAVEAGGVTALLPAVAGDRVAWIAVSQDLAEIGEPAETTVGAGAGPAEQPCPVSYQAVFSGHDLVCLDLQGRLLEPGQGAGTVLDQAQDDSVVRAGLAGSDDGAAWMHDGGSVAHADVTGHVERAAVQGTAADPVTALATGGGTVTLGTEHGRVLMWRPGGAVREVGRVSGRVLSLASYGENVLAVDDTDHATWFGSAGPTVVTDEAAPLGAAMSGDYAVWPERVGDLTPQAYRGWRDIPDTDLRLLSLHTGKVYALDTDRGQQAFPALSGDRLVWLDASLGGADVRTMTIDPGL